MSHPIRTSIMQPMGWEHNMKIREVRSRYQKGGHKPGYVLDLAYFLKGKCIIILILYSQGIVFKCSRPRARRLVLCDIQLCLTWLWWVSRIEKKS